MTRKDYIVIAAALKRARQYYDDEVVFEALKTAAECIAAEMHRDNPRFDTSKFLKACGV